MILVAAVSHDVGHLGVNNAFLIKSKHEIAVRYSFKSPLENMHCAVLFEVRRLSCHCLIQSSLEVFILKKEFNTFLW